MFADLEHFVRLLNALEARYDKGGPEQLVVVFGDIVVQLLIELGFSLETVLVDERGDHLVRVMCLIIPPGVW